MCLCFSFSILISNSSFAEQKGSKNNYSGYDRPYGNSINPPQPSNEKTPTPAKEQPRSSETKEEKSSTATENTNKRNPQTRITGLENLK